MRKEGRGRTGGIGEGIVVKNGVQEIATGSEGEMKVA